MLARAATGKTVSLEVLSALKSLTPREAASLLALNRRRSRYPSPSQLIDRLRSNENRFWVESLERKHLVEKNYTVAYILLGIVAFAIFAHYSINYGIQNPVEGLSIYRTTKQLESWQVVPYILAFIALSFALIFRSTLVQWRLTWLGQQIAHYATEPND